MSNFERALRRVLPRVLPYVLAGLLLLPVIMLETHMTECVAQAARASAGTPSAANEKTQPRPWWFGRAL